MRERERERERDYSLSMPMYTRYVICATVEFLDYQVLQWLSLDTCN